VRLSLAIAPQYRSATASAAAQQAITGLVSAMMLDTGPTSFFLMWCFVMLAFWVDVILIVLRRPLSPTSVDILLIKYGFIPLFIAVYCVLHGLWRALT
jgi:hypothetical protein